MQAFSEKCATEVDPCHRSAPAVSDQERWKKYKSLFFPPLLSQIVHGGGSSFRKKKKKKNRHLSSILELLCHVASGSTTVLQSFPSKKTEEKKKKQRGLGVTVSWSPDDICTALLSRRTRAELEPDWNHGGLFFFSYFFLICEEARCCVNISSDATAEGKNSLLLGRPANEGKRTWSVCVW